MDRHPTSQKKVVYRINTHKDTLVHLFLEEPHHKLNLNLILTFKTNSLPLNQPSEEVRAAEMSSLCQWNMYSDLGSATMRPTTCTFIFFELNSTEKVFQMPFLLLVLFIFTGVRGRQELKVFWISRRCLPFSRNTGHFHSHVCHFGHFQVFRDGNHGNICKNMECSL